MRKVIAASGKQGSGKTTLMMQLEAVLKNEFNIQAVRLRFAHFIYKMHDAAKSILQEHEAGLAELGIHYDFSIKDGNLLQLLGTEWGRSVDPDIWAFLTKLQADKVFKEYEDSGVFVLIEDMRFENEFDVFPDALKVRLNCPKEVRKPRAEMWRENDTHPSEVGLDGYSDGGKFDLYFNTEKQATNEIVIDIVDALKKEENGLHQ